MHNLEGEEIKYEPYQSIISFARTSEEIDAMIEENDFYKNQNLCLNKDLTQAHYRMLLPRLKSTDIYRSFLIRRPDFPTDLLYELALEKPSWFLRNLIMNHPNSNDEIRVILALQKLVDLEDGDK